jgi:hypothetical protein
VLREGEPLAAEIGDAAKPLPALQHKLFGRHVRVLAAQPING